MFPMTNYIILFVVFVLLTFLYRRFEEKRIREENKENYDAIRKYLLEDRSDLAQSKKPILWIHIPYEYNSRNWLSFGSRSSFELNQPYLYLTVRSIINQCGETFHICLVDDNAFEKLIPDWKINIGHLGSPISDKMRNLGMTKLIHMYGGMRVPISFLCFRNLNDMYEKGIRGEKMFVCENIDRNVTSGSFNFYPDITFMGAPKECETVKNLIDFMQRTISTDFTSQSEFLGEFNRWVEYRVRKGYINVIDGKEIGVKDMDDQAITIEMLLGQDYLKLYESAYGIYIPAKDVLNRVSYEWFSRMSPKQVLEGDTILSKYMLLASAPDAKENFETGMGTIEEARIKPTNWVGFWKTPLQASWSIKPNLLGDNLIMLKEPNY
jgi:hypothetical protein